VIDFPTYAETFLRIRTKDRRIAPFVLNGEQQIIWNVVAQQIDDGEPVRIGVLKPRQIGCSTLCEGISWWGLTTHFNTNAITIAHDSDSTRRLLDMAKTFYDHMPIKPMRRWNTRQEIVLDRPETPQYSVDLGLGSRIDIRTAGKIGAGRAVTTHILHCSEIAQWPYPEDLFSGLFNGVPYEPGTMVFMESTAHGAGNWWHEFWEEMKRGANAFRAIFIPWFTVEEYELHGRIMLHWMEKRALDDEEKRLKRIYKLSDGRIAWRRMRISEQKGDKDLFRQEYPSNDEEAWIVAGFPVFDNYRLELALERCKKPIAQGYVDPANVFHEDPKGPLKIWELPKEGKRYTAGCDAALGVEGGDFCCMELLDDQDNQVAEWHQRIEPISFAHRIEGVARWYNSAEVAIELEGQGFSTMAELRKTYFNQYRWRYMDRFVDKMTDQIGWVTNQKTKPLLIALMSEHVRNGSIGIQSKDLVGEMMRFIEPGQAAPGCKDDRVMAMMIAAFVNDVNRPRGRAAVTVPHEKYAIEGLPPEALKDPDYALKHDMGQHLRNVDRPDDLDWRTF